LQNKNARTNSQRKIFCEKALQRRKNRKHNEALKQNIAKAEKMANLKKKRRLKMNKHKRSKRSKANRHKKRTWAC